MASTSCAVMVAPATTTRRRARVFPLAGCSALPGLTALAPRGGHVALRTRPLARRLRLFRLTLRGPRLIDRRGGDPLRGLLGSSADFQILLDVVVLALTLGAPGFLWHGGTSVDRPCKRRASYGASRAQSIASKSAMRSTVTSGGGPAGGAVAGWAPPQRVVGSPPARRPLVRGPQLPSSF